MDKIVSRCGIICSDCDAYIATKNNDDELRKNVAEKWGKMFNANFKAEDINCLGCSSDTQFSYCQTCEIKKCSEDKSLENFSKCDSYSCDRLNEFFKMAPECKNVLDSLR